MSEKSLAIQLGEYRSKDSKDAVVPKSLDVLWELSIVFRLMGYSWCAFPLLMFAASQYAAYIGTMVTALSSLSDSRICDLNDQIQMALAQHEIDRAPHLQPFYELPKSELLSEVHPHRLDRSCCPTDHLKQNRADRLTHRRMRDWKVFHQRERARSRWRLSAEERRCILRAFRKDADDVEHLAHEPLILAAIKNANDVSIPLETRRKLALHAVHYESVVVRASIYPYDNFEELGKRIERAFRRE